MFQSQFNQIRKFTHTRRATLFFNRVEQINSRPLKVIDLGGTVSFWIKWGLTEQHNIHITLINNHYMDGDARGYNNAIPYIQEQNMDVNKIRIEDLQGYDLIFSNSMIEHLETWQLQKQLCEKITDSGVPYFIQFPNSYSPLDPHFPSPLVPFFAIYPKKMKAMLLMLSGFGGGRRCATFEKGMARVKYYNPLNKKEFGVLLPEGDMIAETVLGITPSLIMVRGV